MRPRRVLFLAVGAVIAVCLAYMFIEVWNRTMAPRPDAFVVARYTAATEMGLPSPELETALRERAERLGIDRAAVFIRQGEKRQTIHIGDVDENSLFQAASLSKGVAAMTILLAAEAAGVGVDDDIRPHLPDFDVAGREGGDRPVTLRQLLTHTSGANISGYPGRPRGTELPDSAALLDRNGMFLPSFAFPGEVGRYAYSGGGYQLAQLFAESISGQTFETLARTHVLDPLGMTRSTFRQPLRADAVAPLSIARASSGIRPSEGVFLPMRDSWRDYPEQAAAGLWTTPDDYARFVDALLLASNEDGAGPSASSLARLMLTPHGSDPGIGNCMGVFVEVDDAGRPTAFGHSGGNTGYRSLYNAQLPNGPVVVTMTNAPQGAVFNREIVDALRTTRNIAGSNSAHEKG